MAIMISGENFIITGLQSWNFGLGSNIANLARTISKSNRVLFVNYAFDRLTLIKQDKAKKVYSELRKGTIKPLQQVSDNLWVLTPKTVVESINRIKPTALFNFLNGINSRRFARKIQEAIDDLKFNNFNLLIDSDFYRSFHLKEIIKPKLLLYYIRDNMIATDYYKKHGTRLERELILKADAIFANSEFLAEYAKKINPNSFFVGQGCDLELFNEKNVRPLPQEVTQLRQKFQHIIGYIGALKSTRIDINLLIFLAKKRPGWGFVLVGPEDPTFKESTLHHCQNVFFLGSKPESDLPSYIDFFDVAMNPQLINPITIGNYPRKIDEYLALAKPVVATRTNAMEYFTGYTFLGADPEEFLNCIEQALLPCTTEEKRKRSDFANQHSWEKNVENMYKIMENIPKKLT